MAKILKFDEWLNAITVIIDTREKKNTHITKIFDQMNIKYMSQKLDAGDYTFKYSHYDSKEISKCIIERKNSLDELSQNFTRNRERFNKEFQKLVEDNVMHLIIENNTLDDLISGKYTSNISRNSFIASLLSFEYRYNIKVHFIQNNKYTAFWMVRIFYSYYYANKKRLEYQEKEKGGVLREAIY
jgi:negative regulator of genetic competence, sporulation and motility